MGSACELEYQCLLAQDLNYWPNQSSYEQINQEIIEIKRMLTAFISRLDASRL